MYKNKQCFNSAFNFLTSRFFSEFLAPVHYDEVVSGALPVDVIESSKIEVGRCKLTLA